MKKSIRKNFFETNSSSVHAFTYGGKFDPKKVKQDIYPTKEYGWEESCYVDVLEYAWTGIRYVLSCCQEDCDKLYEEWHKLEEDIKSAYPNANFYKEDKEHPLGYIDHPEEKIDIIKAIIYEPETACCGDIIIGNDNCDSIPTGDIVGGN